MPEGEGLRSYSCGMMPVAACVRFPPKATKLMYSSEMTRRAIDGSHADAGSWQQTHILLPSGSRKYAP